MNSSNRRKLVGMLLAGLLVVGLAGASSRLSLAAGPSASPKPLVYLPLLQHPAEPIARSGLWKGNANQF